MGKSWNYVITVWTSNKIFLNFQAGFPIRFPKLISKKMKMISNFGKIKIKDYKIDWLFGRLLDCSSPGWETEASETWYYRCVVFFPPFWLESTKYSVNKWCFFKIIYLVVFLFRRRAFRWTIGQKCQGTADTSCQRLVFRCERSRIAAFWCGTTIGFCARDFSLI